MPQSPRPRLVLDVESEEELRTLLELDLRKGRAFVRRFVALEPRAPCTLVVSLRSAGAELELDAEAVFSQPDGPHSGIGVELVPFDSHVLDAIETFVSARRRPAAEEVPGEAHAAEGEAEPPDTEGSRQRSLYDRIRGLSLRERDAIARTGVLPERVALERCFGGSVWEALLQNPQLTPQEVARIAKNGSIPKPLVGVIVSNAGWLGRPEVQRALLTNPRVVGAHLDRVLRALSRHDLALVEKNTAYRMVVRASVKKLLSS